MSGIDILLAAVCLNVTSCDLDGSAVAVPIDNTVFGQANDEGDIQMPISFIEKRKTCRLFIIH